ncbi:preprotein translocase subunit SecG [Helicobacter sp. CLO-3]|uniref:preprotein translocase subunit SecG n=1 Tax=unclassified Helicobacter TaxID=2593540 RepID=UPI00080542E0|nr:MULTISPECIES: preprotein translocase subunit SecG [unclassified Helicobacter]OBV29357.1 preprotein translocase subunit SecG [Helicobacter sp. CLO-3]OHU82615.1 preprotein translocase subunit SecG [Helicobacter sp. CLO-3]
MSTLFVVIEIILAIAIVGVVLLQKSSSMGLGVYSGSNESLFGAKGPAGFLAKFTMFLALVFLANTIFLGYQFNTKQQKSVFDSQAIEGSTQSGAPLNRPLNAPLGAPAGTAGVPNWNLNSAPADSAPANSGASTAPVDSAK